MNNQIDPPFSDTLERIWSVSAINRTQLTAFYIFFIHVREYLFMLLQHVYFLHVSVPISVYIYGRAHRFHSFSLSFSPSRSLPIQILAMNEPQTLRSRYIVNAFSHTLSPQWSSFEDWDYLANLSYTGIIAKSLVNLELLRNIDVEGTVLSDVTQKLFSVVSILL